MSVITVSLRMHPRTMRRIKMTQQAFEQIHRTIVLENKRRRAVRLRIAAVLSGQGRNGRKTKRADRLEREVLQTWHRRTGKSVDSRLQAFADIADEAASALNVLKMMSAGMTLTFKPKVIVE